MSALTKFEDGLLHRELLIGIVSSVTAQVVRFNVGSAGSPSGTHFRGGRYGRGEVGEFVLIEGQVTHLLGRIVEIRLPEHDRRSVNAPEKHPHGLDAVGTVQLLGSVAMDSRCITAGVDSYPRLGDRVYSAPHWLLANVATLMESDPSATPAVTLTLGSIDVADDSSVSIKPEKLFGRHCAILGATGGGKSWTTAKIVEECIRHKCKIILLDATGEYRGITGDRVKHYHLGKPIERAEHSKPTSIPPISFIESDFVALFEPSGKVQGPKLRAAIRTLRLANMQPSLAPSGFVKKIDQDKKAFRKAELKAEFAEKLEDPTSEFAVGMLIKQIEQECVYLEGYKQGGARGEKDPDKWGSESGEFANCISLVTRIGAILTSPSFDCVFKSTKNPLMDRIDRFLHNDLRLLRICLSGVSFEFRAREIIANVIGRNLLTRARTGKFIDSPVVVIVDEAHNFLGRHLGNEDAVTKLDAFELIAKEGRKFGLNICLATQRPRDITEGVLSQMGTLIVHRLTNDRDREVVERACGEIDRSAASFLPSLKPGEAAIIGADFPIPLTLQVRPPLQKPLSDGPNFQTSWV